MATSVAGCGGGLFAFLPCVGRLAGMGGAAANRMGNWEGEGARSLFF